MRSLGLILLSIVAMSSGCAVIPEVRHEPQYHNPFPQLHRVAILPFFNLSTEPTINQDEVAEAYYTELQKIPGFEVMPPGVVKRALEANRVTIDGATDFQQLARRLGVDVVIRGAVTDYSPYYPPRIGLTVDWFAANPTYHPIPAGYGLPWGTPDEEYIPDSLLFEAEFALAREQLRTQTPDVPDGLDSRSGSRTDPSVRPAHQQSSSEVGPAEGTEGIGASKPLQPDADGGASKAPPSETRLPAGSEMEPVDGGQGTPGTLGPQLPPDWPDPRGFVPPPPAAERPPFRPQFDPVMSHTRLYDGKDQQFTERLEQYFYFRDEARYGGWQGYLLRGEDFIRFCCHLHITETLAARGGAGKTRVVWRWPIGRYDIGTGRK